MSRNKPTSKEIKCKCLQGQKKEGEKNIDCSYYSRWMKHEVLEQYQKGYMLGMNIGVDMAFNELEAYHTSQMKEVLERVKDMFLIAEDVPKELEKRLTFLIDEELERIKVEK